MTLTYGSVVAAPEESVLPQACTPCMDKLNRKDWDRTLAVATGNWHVGVRGNTAYTVSVLEELLGPVREPRLDDAAQPNFSVSLAPPDKSGPALHIVHRDHEIVARERTVEGLLDKLPSLLDEAPRLGLMDRLVMHASGVVDGEGGVTLVPGRMHSDLLTRTKSLDAAGLRLLPNRTQVVDADAATVLTGIVDPGLRSIADVGETTSLGLVRWCIPAIGNEPFELGNPEAVFAGFSSVVNRAALGAGVTLTALARLVGSLEQRWGFPQDRPALLAERLCTIAGR